MEGLLGRVNVRIPLDRLVLLFLSAVDRGYVQ